MTRVRITKTIDKTGKVKTTITKLPTSNSSSNTVFINGQGFSVAPDKQAAFIKKELEVRSRGSSKPITGITPTTSKIKQAATNFSNKLSTGITNLDIRREQLRREAQIKKESTPAKRRTLAALGFLQPQFKTIGGLLKERKLLATTDVST